MVTPVGSVIPLWNHLLSLFLWLCTLCRKWQTFPCHCHLCVCATRKSVTQSVLLCFLLLIIILIHGDMVVFSAVSMVSPFAVDDDRADLVRAGREKNYCMLLKTASFCHFDGVWSRMKAGGAGKTVQQSWFILTEMERSSILQAALILWDLSWGRGHAGSESLCLYISFCF